MRACSVAYCRDLIPSVYSGTSVSSPQNTGGDENPAARCNTLDLRVADFILTSTRGRRPCVGRCVESLFVSHDRVVTSVEADVRLPLYLDRHTARALTSLVLRWRIALTLQSTV